MDRGAALEAMRGVRVPQPVRQDRRRQARALRGSLHDLSPLPKLSPTLLSGRRVSEDGFEIGSVAEIRGRSRSRFRTLLANSPDRGILSGPEGYRQIGRAH